MFTSARHSVVLDATLYTTENGERKAVDAPQVLFGVGNRKVPSKWLMERLQRQLTRCYLAHEAELPRAFDVAFTIPPQGGDSQLGLANPKSPAERCVDEVLGWQSLPPPPSGKRMTVAGQFNLRLSEVP